jgi:hypothetical protein
MRTLKYFLCSILLLSITSAEAGNLQFFHNTPTGVIRGDEVKIEVMLSGIANEIYDLHLFYRQVGDADYSSTLMKREGLLYQSTINTGEFTTGQMQYYIAYEGALGEIGTFPEEMAELNPIIMEIAPARVLQEDGPVEVVILSPLEEETLKDEDIVVAVYVFSEEEQIDYSNTKLVIDGVNIRTNVDFSDGVVTYTPPPGQKFREGYHNVEVQVFNTEGRVLGQKSWSFRSIRSVSQQPRSFFRGSAFIENRYQSIGPSEDALGNPLEPSDNFFRTGGEISGKYNEWDYRARLVLSSEEDPSRQPVNRYSGEVRYNFSPENNIFLIGGDFNPYYNLLVLQNKRLRGLHAGLNFGFFTFDYMMGQLRRGINGRADSISTSSGLTDFIAVGGTYEQNMWSIRPGFKFGDTAWWTLNLINAKEDKNSIEIGSNVNESVSMGTDLNLNFDQKRVIIDASFNASINNTNAGLEEVAWDTLAKYNEDLQGNDEAKQLWDFLESTGWLSMTTGLNPLPSYAMQFDATFRYFYNNLKIRYYKMDRDFANPGNPYLLKDVSGFQISDNIRLFENQVYLTLFYRNYTTDRSRNEQATDNSELGATLSYFPYQSLPSLNITYANMDRSNGVSATDTDLFRVSNKTQRLSFNTSYNFDVSGTRNAVTLNYTTYGRDEDVHTSAQSDFSLYALGLRTNFAIPLVTRLNYSSSENDIGTATSLTQSNLKVTTFLIGLDYVMDGVMPGDVFKPFANFRLQSVKTHRTERFLNPETVTDIETDRNNFTIGLAYQSPAMGILSIRWDFITYDNTFSDTNLKTPEFNDTILNARYTYNF